MTLFEVIEQLNKIALNQPSISTASEGNIYDKLNANPSVKYGVFHITQGTHTQDETFDHYQLTLFYVDRLVDNLDSNRVFIQSIGKDVLVNIIRTFEDNYELDSSTINVVTFTQRFADETAGAYATVTFDIPKDYNCVEMY